MLPVALMLQKEIQLMMSLTLTLQSDLNVIQDFDTFVAKVDFYANAIVDDNVAAAIGACTLPQHQPTQNSLPSSYQLPTTALPVPNCLLHPAYPPHPQPHAELPKKLLPEAR